MDLAETMKSVLAKSSSSASASSSAGSSAAEGYVTEKLYMLLQLYLQNKGWSPSIELLQCFTELKESSMLPNAAYLQMMASRVGLDTQGRLILRENGKIILPYEHFANAVMLKHMNGPHGLHLGVEGTVRAVVDSYTIGREQFGMEKEFIIEVVQNCPNPACRYYKSQMDMTQKTIQQHLSQQPTYIPDSATVNLSDSQAVERLLRGAALPQDFQLPIAPHLAALASGLPSTSESSGSTSKASSSHSESRRHEKQQHQQLREAMLQQQNRALAQQTMDKYNMTAAAAALEHKQRTAAAAAQLQLEQQAKQQQQQQQQLEQQAKQQQKQHYTDDHKLTDFLRANLESLESLSSAGAGAGGGQERVVRAFSELARNLQRMRPCVRPAMCKPYGKQSEQLQKILLDTIQLVQSLRSYLPPPHIQVTSWKNDDKLRSSNLEDLTMDNRKIASGN